MYDLQKGFPGVMIFQELQQKLLYSSLVAGDSVEEYPISSPNSILAKQTSDRYLASQILGTEKEYIRLLVQASSAR